VRQPWTKSLALCVFYNRSDLNFVIETKGFMIQLREMEIMQSFEHVNIIIIIIIIV